MPSSDPFSGKSESALSLTFITRVTPLTPRKTKFSARCCGGLVRVRATFGDGLLLCVIRETTLQWVVRGLGRAFLYLYLSIYLSRDARGLPLSWLPVPPVGHRARFLRLRPPVFPSRPRLLLSAFQGKKTETPSPARCLLRWRGPRARTQRSHSSTMKPSSGRPTADISTRLAAHSARQLCALTRPPPC